MHGLSFKKSAYWSLDNTVNKYNNKYHCTIKIKPADVKSSTYIDSSKEINDKDLNLKLAILLEYWNIKIILQKFTLQIGPKKFLWLKKLRIMCSGHTILRLTITQKLMRLKRKLLVIVYIW